MEIGANAAQEATVSDNSAKTSRAKKTAKETPASGADGAEAPAGASEPAAKKATAKRAAKKKTTTKKAAKKKAASKKTASKKAATKKAATKKVAKGAAAKKSAAKKSAAKGAAKAGTSTAKPRTTKPRARAKTTATAAAAGETTPAKKTRGKTASAEKASAAKAGAAKAGAAKAGAAGASAKKAAPKRSTSRTRGRSTIAPQASPLHGALNPLALAAALREALAPASLRGEHTPGERAVIAARMPAPFAELLLALGPGTFAGGFLRVMAPEGLDDTLSAWLGGAAPSRVPFAVTALGDILYVRDLSERARSLGLSSDGAYDVSLLSPRWQRVSVLAFTPAELVEILGDPEARAERLGEGLYREARERLGEPDQGELFGFVPALALGGVEDASALQRVRLAEHLDFLRQLVG